MKFQEWAALNSTNTEDAFNAGYEDAMTREDPRDVIIARQAIEIERYKQDFKSFFEAARKSRDAMGEAFSELDKLRFNFF